MRDAAPGRRPRGAAPAPAQPPGSRRGRSRPWACPCPSAWRRPRRRRRARAGAERHSHRARAPPLEELAPRDLPDLATGAHAATRSRNSSASVGCSSPKWTTVPAAAPRRAPAASRPRAELEDHALRRARRAPPPPARWSSRRPRRAPATRITPAAGRAQLIHGAAGHQAAVVDDRHGLADVLDKLELMRGEEHRHTARRLLAQHVGQQVADDRIEAGERLVEDEQIRAMHERRRELHPLLVALRELLDRASARSPRPSRSSQAVAAARA